MADTLTPMDSSEPPEVAAACGFKVTRDPRGYYACRDGSGKIRFTLKADFPIYLMEEVLGIAASEGQAAFARGVSRGKALLQEDLRILLGAAPRDEGKRR